MGCIPWDRHRRHALCGWNGWPGKISVPILILLAALVVGAQTTSLGLPPQTPIPGAPTVACEFPDIDADTPIRITTGDGRIPYQFACGHNRPSGECAVNTLPPGLIVNLGAEQNTWACVTGGDSTSGWIPADRLSPVPATPDAGLTEWLGWWRSGREVRGVKNNRLLITRKAGSNSLHISGRAYWYGPGDNVHFGEVQADATPVGLYLHAVQPFSSGGCVVDLKLDPATRTLQAYDNMQCGGMNVRFGGTWERFLPKKRSRRA
jgi:hypothetical protein